MRAGLRSMAYRRLLGLGAAAALVGTAVSYGAPSVNAVGPTTSSLTAELQHASNGRAKIALRHETGAATFVGGALGSPLQAAGGSPSVAARRFIDHYGLMFGVSKPVTDLTEMGSFDAGSQVTAVRFQQRYHGVPVLAGEIAVQVGSNGNVLSTSGEALPNITVDTTAQVSATDAANMARNLAAKYDGVAAELLTTTEPELWIYDPSLIGADGPAGARLVWRVDARTDVGDVDRLVLIDAQSGDVALQFSQREDALNREVCDNNSSSTLPCASPVRVEGGPPVTNADVNGAYDLSGVTHSFYFTRFGRDSVDGHGLKLQSTVRYCPTPSSADCPYLGAFWNGSQMVYGAGFATVDDVVGHELTHGVTQYTSQLFYYGESGAINESMSDVMGELIDLSHPPDAAADRWLAGEDIVGLGAIRNMANPAQFNDPDRMKSPLYFGGATDAHGVHTNSGVNNKAAFLITDGGSFNGQNIVGLGEAKAAQIYYQANASLLLPGSDYRDLFNILPQACTNMIGTAGITAADCLEVTKAVTATEMNQFPTTSGAHLSAPVCDAGSVLGTALFTDNMENVASGNWTSTSTPVNGEWNYFSGSSQSGTRSIAAEDLPNVSRSTLQGQFSVAVPSGSTYLRFDHSFDLEASGGSYYDGGVVEYSVNGGSTWSDAVALPGSINGYTAVLYSGSGNPLSGRAAFSGPSAGYQTTRINFSSLAGSSVKLRFVLGSDNVGSASGWFIDDVSFYTCTASPGGPSPVPPMSSLVPARLLESRSGLSTV
ncbi:MAG: M4 family metallopeptidase, partial [Ilumatobacteraceae bacterium]